ncbi:hypothetical protein ABPG72_016098 [Tetrahymena utriculariae]
MYPIYISYRSNNWICSAKHDSNANLDINVKIRYLYDEYVNSNHSIFLESIIFQHKENYSQPHNCFCSQSSQTCLYDAILFDEQYFQTVYLTKECLILKANLIQILANKFNVINKLPLRSSDCCIVFVSLMNNFGNIISIKEILDVITSYTNQEAINSSLRIIVPNQIYEAHQQQLKYYLQSEESTNQIKNFQQQIASSKNGWAISLNIKTQYHQIGEQEIGVSAWIIMQESNSNQYLSQLLDENEKKCSPVVMSQTLFENIFKEIYTQKDIQSINMNLLAPALYAIIDKCHNIDEKGTYIIKPNSKAQLTNNYLDFNKNQSYFNDIFEHNEIFCVQFQIYRSQSKFINLAQLELFQVTQVIGIVSDLRIALSPVQTGLYNNSLIGMQILVPKDPSQTYQCMSYFLQKMEEQRIFYSNLTRQYSIGDNEEIESFKLIMGKKFKYHHYLDGVNYTTNFCLGYTLTMQKMYLDYFRLIPNSFDLNNSSFDEYSDDMNQILLQQQHNLISISLITLTCVISILPIYQFIQKKREHILKLMTNISPEKLRQMLGKTKKNSCDIIKNNPKYQSKERDFDYTLCKQISDLYTINDSTQFYLSLKNLDQSNSLIDSPKTIQQVSIVIQQLNYFLEVMTNDLFDYLIFVNVVLLISQISATLIALVFGWYKFYDRMEKSLNETKQLLEVIDLDVLLENSYVISYFKANK